MDLPIIYSVNDSPRLRYVLDWIFNERLKCGYRLTTQYSENVAMCYGRQSDDIISIPATDLLWQNNVSPQEIKSGVWQGIPTIFASGNFSYHLSFDIFSAVFYLISRYEEYFSFTPDKHVRYPATDSILYRQSMLDRPVVDEWIEQLRLLLVEKDYNIPGSKFSFTPTYDIDIAYSYRHKDWKRTAGGFLRDFLFGNTQSLSARAGVVFGSLTDPYDAFEYLEELHKSNRINPIYFILSAAVLSAFDKNIPLTHPSMQQLIKNLSATSIIGIHPSYFVDKNPSLLGSEKQNLENLSGKKITDSRQHYIKLKLPDTCRQLLAAEITDDYSMGYGTHLGFRAGTGSSFLWYDLQREKGSILRMHPFCFMDTTAHYELNLKAGEAFKRLVKMQEFLVATKSTLITVFHNFSLGTDAKWEGWQKEYSRFIGGVATS
jgi:hypothetical protein